MWQNRNLPSHVPTSSSSAKSSIASKSLGILTAQEKPESRMRGNSESDAASSSQARLQDAYLGGFMSTATGKPYVSSKSDCKEGPQAEKMQWLHNLHVSPATNSSYGSSILDPQGDLRTRYTPGQNVYLLNSEE